MIMISYQFVALKLCLESQLMTFTLGLIMLTQRGVCSAVVQNLQIEQRTVVGAASAKWHENLIF